VNFEMIGIERLDSKQEGKGRFKSLPPERPSANSWEDNALGYRSEF
jgi:hypothetical protein